MLSCKKFRSAQYQGMYRHRPTGPCAECVYFSQKNCGLHNGGLHNGGLHDGGLHDGGLHNGGLHNGGLHNGYTPYSPLDPGSTNDVNNTQHPPVAAETVASLQFTQII